MTVRQIAYRLKSEGKTEVISAARAIKEAHVEAFRAAEAGANAAGAATERQERRLKQMAQAARDSAAAQASQAQFNRVIGLDRVTGPSARASAEVFERELSLMDDQERKARALKAALDPAGAAQDRLNAELAEYNALAKAGRISTEQMAQAQAMARARYDETSAAIARQSRGVTRMAAASRLNLARQGADVFTTAAMGMSPMMIAIQQGPQILDAWSTSAIKVTGPMVALAGATALVAGGIVAMSVAYLQGEGRALSYQRVVTGVGRTSGLTAEQIRRSSEAAAEAGNVSESAARQQALAYASTGRIGEEVMTRLITMGRDYASFMGIDAKEATEQLSKSMLEPDKAAREWTRSIGLLDQKTIELIESLVKQGKLTEAQIELSKRVQDAVSGHAGQVGGLTSVWDVATRTMSNYWNRLGEFLYVTRDERIGQLEKALERTYVGRLPEGNRAQIERELTGLRFQQGYDSAKAANDARAAAANQRAQDAKDRADAGKSDRDRAAREAEQRRREAERQAREALQRRRREEDLEATRAMQIAQALQDFDRIGVLEEEERIRTRIRQLIDDGTAAGAARRKAESEDAELRAATAEAASREMRTLSNAANLEADRIEGNYRFIAQAERRNELADRELTIANLLKDVGTARTQAALDQAHIDEARTRVLERNLQIARQEHELAVARALGDREAIRIQEQRSWIQRRAREIESSRQLNFGEGESAATREWRELDSAEATGARWRWAEGLAGDVRRSGLKNALAEQLERGSERFATSLIQQMMKMDWGKIMGSGKLSGFVTKSLDWLIGRNASGTDYWRGGLTWVGERGAELVDLPRGAKVIEHGRSLDMARRSSASASASGPGRGAFVFAPNIDARGAGPREVEALNRKMDEMAANLRSNVLSYVEDGLERRLIGG